MSRLAFLASAIFIGATNVAAKTPSHPFNFRFSGSPAPVAAQIMVDGASNIAAITSRQIGVNMGTWAADVTSSTTLGKIQAMGARTVRWPGGSSSDYYHWQNHIDCLVVVATATPKTYAPNAGFNPNNTFDHFMQDVVIPGGLEAVMTVDYGTNITCDGGADPHEAAAWVAYSKAHNYNAHYWTVGNEQYGGWEVDLHPTPTVGTAYAANMAGPNGFYSLMKAADSTAQIGAVVVAVGWNNFNGWDAGVLTNAPFDYVEVHWYAQQPGQESDAYLLNQAPLDFTGTIATLRSELVQAGKSANTPIMVGEFNSVAYSPGKQTISIVNALFMGMTFGEMLNDNTTINTMWFGTGGNANCGNNISSSLYGWQDFGGYDGVASTTKYFWPGCGSGLTVPEGSILPNGRALYLASQFAVPGNHMLNVAVNHQPNVRAYAATQGTGYALMLFNVDQSSAATVTLAVASPGKGSYTATAQTYGKLQYDDSKNNVWTGPVTQSLGTVGANSTVVLPPLSMTVLKLQ